jgi:hypothetical protein
VRPGDFDSFNKPIRAKLRLRMEDPRIEGAGQYENRDKPTNAIHKWPKHKREDRYSDRIAAVVAKARANT